MVQTSSQPGLKVYDIFRRGIIADFHVLQSLS
jgi:hypothetical protein